MDIIWNFQAWGSFRHDYMFLPDSRLNSEEYKKKYDIKTIEVFSDIVDEDGSDNWNSLYKNKKTHFHTILSCFSFTQEDMLEMWFMNNAANFILKNWYDETLMPAPIFAKLCYEVIYTLDEFKPLHEEIKDKFNPNTPPQSIRQLGGKFRVETIEEFLKENKIFIISGVLAKWFKTSTQKDTSNYLSLADLT
jgi:hypothetical protein